MKCSHGDKFKIVKVKELLVKVINLLWQKLDKVVLQSDMLVLSTLCAGDVPKKKP